MSRAKKYHKHNGVVVVLFVNFVDGCRATNFCGRKPMRCAPKSAKKLNMYRKEKIGKNDECKTESTSSNSTVCRTITRNNSDLC